MQKQAPSLGRILVMVGFALSCFGILLYLWLVFGGAVPFKPRGYEVTMEVPEATTLADEADVRISGVSVGKVKKLEPVEAPRGSLEPVTKAVLEIDSRYAPIPKDVRAILRQKTLLGETYVELTPGNKASGRLQDGGSLPRAAVSPTVELDEIFRAFDARTRAALRTWMEEQGTAFDRRGEDLNDALGNLTPFAEDVNDVLKILRRQDTSTRRLVRNTGEVFAALTERDGQLRDLITNSNLVFQTTAQRDQELRDAIRAFPTFLDESRTTVTRVTRFARQTNPLITQLRPAAREISPTLIELRSLAPDLKGLFRDLDPLITVSRRGLPALERLLDETRPLLGQIDPFLRNVNPILDYLGFYRREIAAFFALDVASTQATDPPGGPHYLRTTNPINPENLAAYPKRIATNRSNPYVEPGGYSKLATGLEVFGQYLCSSNPVPALNSPSSGLSDLIPGLPPVPNFLPESTYALIDQFAYGGQPPGAVPAPPCKPQAPLGRLLGQSGLYPHVEEAPERP
jgi:phospholipid/cholesterol/gamma-HCH transport system substrate-binding protein